MSATSSVAFGLQLEAEFALPGTRELTVPGLPELRIELASAERLDELWDSRGAGTEWTGMLGDGHELRIDRDGSGARLFSYGERARFHLDERMERLTCVPDRPGLDWQRTLLGKVVPAISVMRGYEALHAAAVQGPHGAVAIAAPSGTGKSTLALELLRRGWPLICDDVLALSPLPRGALAHPGMAQITIAAEPSGALPHQLQTIGVLGAERWCAVADAAAAASPVAAVVLLDRGGDEPPACEVLEGAMVALAPFMLGIAADARRRSERFELFAELAGSTPVLRLSAPPQAAPEELADALQAALSTPWVGR